MSTRARDLLGQDGPFARSLPGYEAREAQLTMADAVERALSEDRKLVVEAGTGTGKTLAYLIPAILSGRKIVVSTATKALQEQIVFKDLPLIAQHTGLVPEVALVKGLSNYLCLRRYNEFRTSPEAMRPMHAASLNLLDRWSGETESGDLAELVGMREGDPVREEIASSSDTRIGNGCSYYDRCYVTRMKREAEAARILVVNHHLFFADLALRGAHEGGALPGYDAVIFDEAHQIEDVATDFFGTRVSTSRIETFCRDAERSLIAAGAADEARRAVGDARGAAERFFSGLGGRSGEIGRQSLDPGAWTDAETADWHALDAALEAIEKIAETRGGESLDVVRRRARAARDDLARVVDGPGRRVTWVEATSRAISIGASPIDVAEVLKTRLFETLPAAVLTSATMQTGTGFSFLRARVGLDDDVGPVDELSLPSPFDYAENALLYVPRDLPEVSDAGFIPAAGERVADLVRASGGGAFVLCTSNRVMRGLHAELGRRGVRPLMLQGEAPKSSLLGRFRSTNGAVLVATMSFWEGVDVPGDALRLVIIDKTPFPVPTDPLVAARSAALDEAGENAFTGYHVPTAAIALKQGFGRLIRTASDRGVVAILDRRLLTRGYGKTLLAALPPACRTEKLEDVETFFREG